MENLVLHSTTTQNGSVRLSLDPAPVDAPGDDEVVVRVEATPINPSDLGAMLGPADLATAKAEGTGAARTVTARVPEQYLSAAAGWINQPVPIGYEGAGTVVSTGRNAQPLMGKRVGVMGFGLFSRYYKARAMDCIPLPEGTATAEGAALFVNPLTALCMVEALRLEGHRGLVHTAAASNLGQMLNRICIADGVNLVNIVRSQAQVDLLKKAGAKHVVNSSAPNFHADLTAACAATGATLAFDAVGGGALVNEILRAMEEAARQGNKGFGYGSGVYKHIYIYGMLDGSPTVIDRSYGMDWSVSGFIMTGFLGKIGAEAAVRLRSRIVREMKTTFASHYAGTIGFKELFDPAMLAMLNKQSTGQKYLLDPSRPA